MSILIEDYLANKSFILLSGWLPHLLSYGVTASTGGSNPLSLGSNPSGITLMPCSIMVITADSKSVAF